MRNNVSKTREERRMSAKRELQFQNDFHKRVFDGARGRQKKTLTALLKRGYGIERVNGREGIEIRKGRLWRCITTDGMDLPPSKF